MPHPAIERDTHVAALRNGVRLVTLPRAHLASANISVFVRCGSAHEPRRFNGIGHVIEHMVFKGTATRDRRRINLDAERLGADVNAHTDKDHTAFHIRGLAEHAGVFVRMLGDLVQHASFPADELESERQVLLAEFAEDEDDPMSTAFKLFDRACFGQHPVAQPVIGTRGHIERFRRDDLVAHVQRHYSGANLVVAAAGPLDPDEMLNQVQAAFGDMPQGTLNQVPPADYAGGIASRHLDGTGQAHAVVGWALPAMAQDDAVSPLAAAVLGEGMSSPLMEHLRERMGLVYHAACSADLYDMCGQFVIEASMAPERLDECLGEITRLLLSQAQVIDPLDLDRARHQIAVRRLRSEEKPSQMLEEAALDLFCFGRVRSAAEHRERLASVSSPEVRAVFERGLASGASVAITGQVGRGLRDRVRQSMGPILGLTRPAA